MGPPPSPPPWKMVISKIDGEEKNIVCRKEKRKNFMTARINMKCVPVHTCPLYVNY